METDEGTPGCGMGRPPAPMTVDELLAKLDAEYDRITGELPKAYEDYGRAIYPKVQQTVAGVYASDCMYERDKIKDRETRMERIRYIQQIIRFEMPYKGAA